MMQTFFCFYQICLAWAQCNLGFCLAEALGCERNLEEAVMWYEKASQQDHSRAMNRLGMSYRDGAGCQRNYEKMIYWFTRAANLNNTAAQYNLGLCYESGIGVEKSIEKAMVWFEKAAASGDPASNEHLTRLLTNSCFSSMNSLTFGHAACAA